MRVIKYFERKKEENRLSKPKQLDEIATESGRIWLFQCEENVFIWVGWAQSHNHKKSIASVVLNKSK